MHAAAQGSADGQQQQVKRAEEWADFLNRTGGGGPTAPQQQPQARRDDRTTGTTAAPPQPVQETSSSEEDSSEEESSADEHAVGERGAHGAARNGAVKQAAKPMVSHSLPVSAADGALHAGFTHAQHTKSSSQKQEHRCGPQAEEESEESDSSDEEASSREGSSEEASSSSSEEEDDAVERAAKQLSGAASQFVGSTQSIAKQPGATQRASVGMGRGQGGLRDGVHKGSRAHGTAQKLIFEDASEEDKGVVCG